MEKEKLIEKVKSKALFIDHTNLSPIAKKEDILALCHEAREYGFASVCLLPFWVPLAYEELKNSAVKVCTVAGFPLGGNLPEIKAQEAALSSRQGAKEIDMVINIAALKAGENNFIEEEIKAVVTAAGENCAVKVIIEACYLKDEEKTSACLLAKKAGAAYVKTSTGLGKAGALLEDVKLLYKASGGAIGIKAAGGIKTLAQMEAMLEAGARRIGTSSGISIMGELLKRYGE